MDGLIAYALSKKYADEVGQSILDAGFKTQVEQDRSILQTVGQEKILYFIPKTTAKPSDGYDEYVYSNNAWEQVGVTDVDLSSYATKEWTTKQIEDAVGVLKTDISGAVVTLNQSAYTYDGTSKAPIVVSVTLNGRALAAGTDYVVVANPATNAGQYVVVVNGMGDYKGTVTTAWEIAKAQATISGDDSIKITGIDDPVTKTYTTDGDGVFSFAISGNIATVANIGGEVTITPTALGSSTMTVTLSDGANYLGATKTVPVEIVNPATVFGVMWDYSLSSPQLVRLTPQTDPLGVVTTVPLQEPTACVGNDGNGQSDFDNYMPWAGMQRYNYVNEQVVDFVDYSNGETFVYIPEFWSKIVDDSENNKMYFYISDSELSTFVKHPGSDRYISRYDCGLNMLSTPNAAPSSSHIVTEFRNGIRAISNNHYMCDFHVINAVKLLYLIEFSNFNSQLKIGQGVTNSNDMISNGGTDALLYHSGRALGVTDDTSSIHYRWIENLWGNGWTLLDGVIVYNSLVSLCDDINNYNDFQYYYQIGEQIEYAEGWGMTLQSYGNAYIMPLITGGSDSTYQCDYKYRSASAEFCALAIGSGFGSGSNGGLFSWNSGYVYNTIYGGVSARSMLIFGGDS